MGGPRGPDAPSWKGAKVPGNNKRTIHVRRSGRKSRKRVKKGDRFSDAGFSGRREWDSRVGVRVERKKLGC